MALRVKPEARNGELLVAESSRGPDTVKGKERPERQGHLESCRVRCPQVTGLEILRERRGVGHLKRQIKSYSRRVWSVQRCTWLSQASLHRRIPTHWHTWTSMTGGVRRNRASAEVCTPRLVLGTQMQTRRRCAINQPSKINCALGATRRLLWCFEVRPGLPIQRLQFVGRRSGRMTRCYARGRICISDEHVRCYGRYHQPFHVWSRFRRSRYIVEAFEQLATRVSGERR